jgi:hypothetical protein
MGLYYHKYRREERREERTGCGGPLTIDDGRWVIRSAERKRNEYELEEQQVDNVEQHEQASGPYSFLRNE